MNTWNKLLSGAQNLRSRINDLTTSKEQLEVPEIYLDEVPSSEPVEVDISSKVPLGLRVAAAWSWRLIVVVIMGVAFLWAMSKIQIVVIPFFVALLLSVLLEPILRLLYVYMKLPRTLSAVLALLVGVGGVIGLIWLATSQIVNGMADVVARAQDGLNQGLKWLSEGPLQLDLETVQRIWEQGKHNLHAFVSNHASSLASNALSTVSSGATFVTGALTALFCLFFFLKDGRKIWQWVLRLFPVGTRDSLNEAVIRGWITLGAYARTQTLVAAIDALGIGVGAYIIGVPLALPLGVLVFLASFIPILGAITTGFIAVLVALVDQGFTKALIMLVIILVVQQVESNLLQPMLMSSAVNVHPMAVLLAVAAGGYLMGITGAVFAVPVVAFLNTTILYLKGHDKFIYLNYWKDRPGGAPGTLHKEIAYSLRPDRAVIEQAEKMRLAAISKGELPVQQTQQAVDSQVKLRPKDEVSDPSDPKLPPSSDITEILEQSQN